MPRKHLIASGINKKQQQQAKTWMKCAKEIKAAARVGGTNPDANPRLKAAIARALQNNLSRDSIEKNINGATKDQTQLKELFYEGYGPNGLAILIKAITDNEQRTISSLRGYFSKFNAQLAKPNSVMILFDELGEIIIDKQKYSEDEIFNIIIELPILDFKSEDDCFVILTKPNDFFQVKDKLNTHNIDLFSAEIKYIPNQWNKIDEQHMEKYERFINACEDDDDIQWVITNLDD